MSLLDLKKYMLQVKMTSLSNLCQFFNMEPEMMRCLLKHWITKGKIRPCLREPACGSKCFKCPTATREMYEWVEGAAIL